MKKNQKGITLVSMVITIIVMLILAGVSISAAINDDGVATKASQATLKTKLSSVEEEFNRALTNVLLDYESDKVEASSISAYKGVYVTYEKLNKNLKNCQILAKGNGATGSSTADVYVDSNFTKTQKDIIGTADANAPKVDLVKKRCWTGEHPINQLSFAEAARLLNNMNKGPAENRFVMYLTSGKDSKSLGTDVYAVILKLEDGVPHFYDIGLVESDIRATALKNGVIKPDASNGFVALEDNSKLPTTVRWLHHESGLKDLKNGVVVEN